MAKIAIGLWSAMALNVSLTPHLEEFVRRKVESGLYNSASEVVREALRLLEVSDHARDRRVQAVLGSATERKDDALVSGGTGELDLDKWFNRRMAAMMGVAPQMNALTDKLLKEVPTAKGQPVFVFTSGVPGSGKTTLTRMLVDNKEQFASVPAHHMFDQIMEAYPEYHADYEKYGMETAFQKWELVARITGYEVLRQLFKKRANIVFEHSFSDATHVDLLRVLKADTDYKLVYMPIECPVETCLERIKIRDKDKPRFVPIGYIAERAEVIKELQPNYLSLVDKVVRIDNSGKLPEKVEIL